MLYSVIGVIWFILFIIALIDILKSGMDGVNKLVWILVVLFLGPIGTILWFLIGKK